MLMIVACMHYVSLLLVAETNLEFRGLISSSSISTHIFPLLFFFFPLFSSSPLPPMGFLTVGELKPPAPSPNLPLLIT